MEIFNSVSLRPDVMKPFQLRIATCLSILPCVKSVFGEALPQGQHFNTYLPRLVVCEVLGQGIKYVTTGQEGV